MRSLFRKYYKTETFCQFPKPAFIENIAGDDGGNLYVTSVDEGRVYKVGPDRSVEQYAQMRGRLAYEGVIWKYDLRSNQADIWIRHHLLSRINPNSPMPAANGIKIFGNMVFVSNTARQLLLSIPLADNKPGEPDVFLDDLNLDDFAIDARGTIYATTHIYNSVIEITADKQVSIIAEGDQGLAGSTAAMLGKTGKDNHSLYVTTNGGLSLPLPHGLEDGKIIKIDLQ